MSKRPEPWDEESRPADHPHRRTETDKFAWMKGTPRSVYDDAVGAASDELIYTSDGSTVLNLATLQRIVLFHQQVKIVKQAGALANRRFAQVNLDTLSADIAVYGKSRHSSLQQGADDCSTSGP